jgi:hypothetical protein
MFRKYILCELRTDGFGEYISLTYRVGAHRQTFKVNYFILNESAILRLVCMINKRRHGLMRLKRLRPEGNILWSNGIELLSILEPGYKGVRFRAHFRTGLERGSC